MSTPPPDLGAVDLVPLVGGVSGAAVWRAGLRGRSVVKRTEPLELIALDLLADRAEPLIPEVIWVVTGAVARSDQPRLGFDLDQRRVLPGGGNP